MATLLSKQHHESNLAFLCTTHSENWSFYQTETAAASTKLRLTWAAGKMKSTPNPGRAGTAAHDPVTHVKHNTMRGIFPHASTG